MCSKMTSATLGFVKLQFSGGEEADWTEAAGEMWQDFQFLQIAILGDLWEPSGRWDSETQASRGDNLGVFERSQWDSLDLQVVLAPGPLSSEWLVSQVGFSLVIYSVLLLSKKRSIEKKSVEFWNIFQLWKAFILHMKLRTDLAPFVEIMRKLLPVFKLATTDASWHSLMEGVNPAHPLPLSELWINRDTRRWTEEKRMTPWLQTKRKLEIEETMDF